MPSNLETIKFMCVKSKDAVAFLNCEGHNKDTAVIQRKGILRYEINIRGVSLHSGNAATASNVILEAAHKIIELEKTKNPEGLTFNCGVIHGGTTPNTVAGECTFLVDIRFIDDKEEKCARDKVCEVTAHTTVAGGKIHSRDEFGMLTTLKESAKRLAAVAYCI